MGSSVLSIGVSALNAAQAGLVTTEHNISNVNTPGYHRQQNLQSTAIPQLTGAGFFGQGVQINSVQRVYSQFLDGQVLQAQTQSSYLSSYYAQISQIDNMLADPNAGLSPALQGFFSGVQDVATNPSSSPSRQNMLSSAQTLVSQFQSLNQRFQQIRDGVNTQITSMVSEINSYGQQIANLNAQITQAQASAQSYQPANDLLDQRQQIISELNQRVKVTTATQADGSVNVYIGNGQPLVVGQQAFTLKAQTSNEDPERVTVAYANGAGSVPIQEASLTGGTLGGLLAFRSQSLDSAQNALGRVAIGLAQTFNDQHRLGQDLNGNLGSNFFNVATPKVIANALNSGTANVAATITDVGSLTTSDYQLAFDGTNYKVTRLSDNAVMYNNSAFPSGTIDGFNISLSSGALAAGDRFLIQPTRNGANAIGVAITNTSEIAAAAPIRAAATTSNTGTGVISSGSVNPPPPPSASLRNSVTITFTSPTQFDVVDNTTSTTLATGVTYTSGGAISYNGWTVQITGAPAAGDTFSVTANTGGLDDPRNALLLAQLQTANTLQKNAAGIATATYQSSYSQLASDVGNKTRELQITGKAQDALVSQTQQAQQSLSGVNLDEEAANLVRYQQAYQAAGKMMQVADTVFQTLLSLGR